VQQTEAMRRQKQQAEAQRSGQVETVLMSRRFSRPLLRTDRLTVSAQGEGVESLLHTTARRALCLVLGSLARQTA